MLVIRRRAGESILIAGDIEVEILGLTPTQVKLGISAPKTVPILRKEVRSTGEQNVAATQLGSIESIAGVLDIFRGGRQDCLKGSSARPISSL